MRRALLLILVPLALIGCGDKSRSDKIHEAEADCSPAGVARLQGIGKRGFYVVCRDGRVFYVKDG